MARFTIHRILTRMHIEDTRSIFLHMDNCPIHKATLIKDHLAKRGYNTSLLSIPPTLRTWPGLADFLLFPKAKDNLEGVSNGGETAKARWRRDHLQQ